MKDINRSWFLEEIEIRCTITGNFGIEDSQVLVPALAEEASIRIEHVESIYEFETSEPNKQNRLVPKTTIAVKIPRFLWGMCQTTLSAIWVAINNGMFLCQSQSIANSKIATQILGL